MAADWSSPCCVFVVFLAPLAVYNCLDSVILSISTSLVRINSVASVVCVRLAEGGAVDTPLVEAVAVQHILWTVEELLCFTLVLIKFSDKTPAHQSWPFQFTVRATPWAKIPPLKQADRTDFKPPTCSWLRFWDSQFLSRHLLITLYSHDCKPRREGKTYPKCATLSSLSWRQPGEVRDADGTLEHGRRHCCVSIQWGVYQVLVLAPLQVARTHPVPSADAAWPLAQLIPLTTPAWTHPGGDCWSISHTVWGFLSPEGCRVHTTTWLSVCSSELVLLFRDVIVLDWLKTDFSVKHLDMLLDCR